MPRIRSIKPDIWHDEALGAVGLEAQLLFVGLITQADDEGRLRGDARLIRSQIFPYHAPPPEQVESWLAELDRVGVIQRYAHAGRPFICLPAWERHQVIQRARKSVLPGPLEEGSSSAQGSLLEASQPEKERKRTSEAKASDSSIPPVEATSLPENEEPNRSEIPTEGRLCDLLRDLVIANGCKAPTITQRWLDAERLLVEVDKRDPTEAEQLIRWCQGDEFWKANVRSMPKFREQYDQLRLHAARKAGVKPIGERPDFSAYDRASTRVEASGAPA